MTSTNNTMVENEFPDFFQGGTFSYNDGPEYSVPKVIQTLEANQHHVSLVHVRRLIKYTLNGDSWGDEPVGSAEWSNRAYQADMKYPILVIRNREHIWAADGNHRLWRAFKRGQRYIKAYVIDEDKLLSIV